MHQMFCCMTLKVEILMAKILCGQVDKTFDKAAWYGIPDIRHMIFAKAAWQLK